MQRKTWKNDPETTPSSLRQSSFQTDRGKVQTVLRAEKSKSEILFGKLRCHAHFPACYQHSKAWISDGMWYWCLWIWQLHIWKGTIKVKSRYKATKAAAFSENKEYLSKTMLNWTLHLSKQHDFTVEESGCWTEFPAVQTFKMKTFGSSWMNNQTKKALDYGATRILYQRRTGQHSSPKPPAAGLFNWCSKRLCGGKLGTCSCHQIQNKLFFFFLKMVHLIFFCVE